MTCITHNVPVGFLEDVIRHAGDVMSWNNGSGMDHDPLLLPSVTSNYESKTEDETLMLSFEMPYCSLPYHSILHSLCVLNP